MDKEYIYVLYDPSLCINTKNTTRYLKSYGWETVCYKDDWSLSFMFHGIQLRQIRQVVYIAVLDWTIMIPQKDYILGLYSNCNGYQFMRILPGNCFYFL